MLTNELSPLFTPLATPPLSGILKTYFDMVAKGPASPTGEAGVKQPHTSVDGV